MVGVTVRTAYAYAAGRRRLPEHRARRLADFLEADLVERMEVIRLLREIRDEPRERAKEARLAANRAKWHEKRMAKLRGKPVDPTSDRR
jgi:hypothetical protein